MHSEYNFAADFSACDNNVDFYKLTCLTHFIGLSGTFNWDHQENQDFVWNYLGPIRNLMEDIKLDEENWRPGEPIVPTNTDDEPIEVYYLVSEQSSTNAPRKAVGVIANRTYNWFTQGNALPCISQGNNPGPNVYDNIENYQYDDIAHLNLKIPNMGTTKDYKIDWYNALNGNFIGTIDVSTGLSENLDLEYPGILTGDNPGLVDDECPIYFFEVYPQGSIFKSHENQTNLYEEDLRESYSNNKETIVANQSVQINPNPFQNKVEITCPEEMINNGSWTVTDFQGKKIKSGKIDSQQWQIDLGFVESGVYMVTIQTNVEYHSFKIIKQ